MTTSRPQAWKRSAKTVKAAISQIYGDWTRANYRLAPIVHGCVMCVHIETAEIYECGFSEKSGAWAEGEAGRFAGVGQAICRDGAPGGEYLIAAKIREDLCVPCLDIVQFDIRGPAAGCELGGEAVVEEMLMPWNGTGQPLRHFCTLPVCTSSNPHPDAAELVGSAAGPTFCYTGMGAALNDINGREADEFGTYLIGNQFAHVVRSSGFEVPAAKRPATRTLPPSVQTHTPIVWRPVNPHLLIGSPNIAGGGCP